MSTIDLTTAVLEQVDAAMRDHAGGPATGAARAG